MNDFLGGPSHPLSFSLLAGDRRTTQFCLWLCERAETSSGPVMAVIPESWSIITRAQLRGFVNGKVGEPLSVLGDALSRRLKMSYQNGSQQTEAYV